MGPGQWDNQGYEQGGQGAGKGMSVPAHFEWSRMQPHMGYDEEPDLPLKVDEALAFEIEHDWNEVDWERGYSSEGLSGGSRYR